MSIDCDTVGELIEALKKFAPETTVCASFEGQIVPSCRVYRHKNGICVIDVDGCFYEHSFSDGSL